MAKKEKAKRYVTVLVPRQEMLELLDYKNPALLSDTLEDHTRWSVGHTIVFRRGDKLYEAYYRRPATECQEEQPWEYEEEVQCTEVVEMEVTRKEYVRVED